MRVSFRFYSVAKDLVGVSELPIELPTGTSLGAALDTLITYIPALAPLRTSSLFAVGLDYAAGSTVIKEGDEISFIPPVQGG